MRNSKEIKVWMIRNDHTVESIRQALGYRNHMSVSLTISGEKSSRKVLQYLKDQGCSVQYLALPKNFKP